MTKEEARKILEDWINANTQDRLGEHRDMRLPITDEKIITIQSPEPKIATTLQEQDEINSRPHTISDWSFKGLIKIAYDLK